MIAGPLKPHGSRPYLASCALIRTVSQDQLQKQSSVLYMYDRYLYINTRAVPPVYQQAHKVYV